MSNIKIFHNDNNLTYKQVSSKRSILAFFLFVCIVICTTCISGGVGVVNKDEIAKSLLESSYINALTNDVKQYATDLCEQAGVPKNIVDDSVDYNKMYELEKSYIYGDLFESTDYNENAFLANILHLKSDITNALTSSLENNGLIIDENMQNSIDNMSTNVSNYAKQRIRFINEDMYKNVVDNIKLVNICLIGVCIFVSALIIIRLLTIGNKKYRSLRYAVYSFSAASLFNFITVIIFSVVNSRQPRIIQPSYLQNAIDSYINSSSYNFIMLSLFVFFIAICLSAISWIMKRRNI